MQDLHIRRLYEREDQESPMIPCSVSLMTHKICPFSPSKISEISGSEEETSMFKTPTSQKFIAARQRPKLELDISSIRATPNKNIASHLLEIKAQLFNLSNKFTDHQQDIKELVTEGHDLKSRIIQLQESLISINETSLQEKSKCKCSIF
jgi:chromosome segregation ATPase